MCLVLPNSVQSLPWAALRLRSRDPERLTRALPPRPACPARTRRASGIRAEITKLCPGPQESPQTLDPSTPGGLRVHLPSYDKSGSWGCFKNSLGHQQIRGRLISPERWLAASVASSYFYLMEAEIRICLAWGFLGELQGCGLPIPSTCVTLGRGSAASCSRTLTLALAWPGPCPSRPRGSD